MMTESILFSRSQPYDLSSASRIKDDIQDPETPKTIVSNNESSNNIQKFLRSPRRKITEKQQEIIIDFMEKHPDLCRGNYAHADRVKLWERLVQTLNETGVGPAKDVEKWKKTWADWKCFVKGKVGKIIRTQNCQQRDVKEYSMAYLSPLEERMVRVAGWISDAAFEPSTKLEGKQVSKFQIEATSVLNENANSPQSVDAINESRRTLAQLLVIPQPISCQVPISTASVAESTEEPETPNLVPRMEERNETKDESQNEMPARVGLESGPAELIDITRKHIEVLSGIRDQLSAIAESQRRRATAGERKATAMENIANILGRMY